MNGGLGARQKIQERLDAGDLTQAEATVMAEIKMWRTPNSTVIDAKSTVVKLLGRTPQDPQVGLADQVMAAERGAWPTPAAQGGYGGGSGGREMMRGRIPDEEFRQMTAGNGGQLNPTWVELLMGWPRGWSSLEPMDGDEMLAWVEGFTNGTETGIGEELPELREETTPETLRATAGGFRGVSEAQVLQHSLREHEEDSHQARLQLACQETPQGMLRGVRGDPASASAPHRPGHDEQPAREHPDVVQVVPRLFPQYGPQAWANGSWENGVPRVATGIAHRVDRLKAIGNGQVPAVVATVWNLLTE